MKDRFRPAARAVARRRCLRSLRIEHLEDRSLLAALVMTPQEQLLLELVNRARANPVGEAARYGVELNQGFAPGTISAAAKQPLAANQFLRNAAAAHSQDMLDNNFFAHTNLQGQSASDRARAAGYPRGAAENISWGGSTGPIDQNAHVLDRHRRLFLSPGHRRNLLSTGHRELGTGVRYGVFSTGGTGYNASMVTENFGNAGGNVFITGVAFTDAIVPDNFYTIGEAVTNGTVTATRVGGGSYSTPLGPSGGYSLQVPDGSYSVTHSGRAGSFQVLVSGENEKLDFVVNNSGPAPDPTPDPTPDPPGPVDIIDDGDAFFAQFGRGWSRGGITGAHGGDYLSHAAGSGANRVTWTFENVQDGTYEVLATWIAHTNRGSNTPFTIRDGAAVEQTVRENQRAAPDDLVADGRSWESLGIYTIDNGRLSVELNDDANGYVIADAIRIAPSNDPPSHPPANDPPPNDPPNNDPPPPSNPPATPRVVDDGGSDYEVVGGSWSRGGIAGAYDGDYQYHAGGSGSSRVRWNFTDLADGTYEVLATWLAHANRASNAPFTIRDGAVLEETTRVNQRTVPDDLVADGRSWDRLGVYSVENGSLRVELSDDANGFVIADAVRLAPSNGVPNDPPPDDPPPPNDPPGEPRIVDDGDSAYRVFGGGWSRGGIVGAYGGDYAYHSPGNGSNRVSWSFTSLPNGTYDVFATWTPHSNRASNASFTVRDGNQFENVVRQDQRARPDDLVAAGRAWERLGSYTVENGALSVELSDAANGFVIADAIRVVPTSTHPEPPSSELPRVVDDGQAGYTESGAAWRRGGLSGASGNGYRFVPRGTGTNRASWTFGGLTQGRYEVFASWVAHGNRASNAPFTILDGGSSVATVRVNQRQSPDDLTAGGQTWERLGTFQIDAGILSVSLSDDANGYVIADAIRIVAVE